MRCTKCHYLSFDPEPRCRNCGHDLSLEEGSAFSLAGGTLDSIEDAVGGHESHRSATAVLAPPRTASATSSSRIPTADLPLFVQSIQSVSDHLAGDEPEELEPLVKVPARPRTPVSVRRATPDPARLRAKYGMPPSPEPDLWSNIPAEPIDQVALHDEPEVFQDLPLTTKKDQWTNEQVGQWTNAPAADSADEPEPHSPAWASVPTPERLPVGWEQPVTAGARLGAALIDAVLLGGISAGVIYFTLQVTGLSMSQIGLLPMLPLGGLLVMLAVGYLLMFTVASGQTIGKMAMHLRVVDTSPEADINDRISVSQGIVRAVAALPSVLVLGLGFVPALLGAGLALHDRIAHTRVVRL